jgi:aspartyl/asparaginyl beta-hydroxylase (cupin superfamily)
MSSSTVEGPEYFLIEETYTGKHGFFYDAKQFPAIKALESNWHIIRDEISRLISNEEEIDVKNLNPPYLSSPEAWKNLYFYNFGWQKHKNCDRYPKTHALLKSIPNLVFGGITVLKPKSKVLPHNGETNTTIRCHLGLKIPAPYPICGVRVGTEERGWEEGKVIMFSDAHYHTAWNDSNEQRFVLVFDIVRDEFANQKHWVCAKVLGALSLKMFYSKKPELKKVPMPLIRTAHSVFSTFWYLYLPMQNRFRLP